MSLLEIKLRELFLKISTEPFWESSQSTVFVCPSYTFAFKSCSHARPTKSSGQNARNGFDGNCKNGCWKWTSNVHRNNADRCSFATGLFFLNFCVHLNVVMQDLLNELSFQKILTFSLAKLFNFKSRTTFSFTDQVISLSQHCTTDIPCHTDISRYAALISHDVSLGRYQPIAATYVSEKLDPVSAARKPASSYRFRLITERYDRNTVLINQCMSRGAHG